MKINIYYLIFLSLLLASCGNDDTETLFDEKPANRAAADIEELNASLLSSATFKGVYFPKNDEFGGSVLFFKFNEDGTVDMSSNFDNEVAITSGQFDVRQNTSTELVFTTFNQIHKLSDNNINGLRGTGFKGASNFVYIGTADDGSIELFDTRNEATLILNPISNEEFLTSPDAATESFSNEQALTPSATTSVFQQLIVNTGNSLSNFDLSFDSLRLYVTVQGRSETGVITQNIEFGIAFTAEGLTVSPSITVDGVTFVDFIFNEEDGTFISKVGNATAVLGSSSEPAYIGNDLSEIIAARGGISQFLYRPSLGRSPLTSAGFDALTQEVSTRSSVFGVVFSELTIFYDFNSTDDCSILVRVNYQGNNADYCFSIDKVEGKKLFLIYNGPGPGLGGLLENASKPIIDFLNSENGLILTQGGTYSVGGTNYGGVVAATITSVESPSQRVYGLYFL